MQLDSYDASSRHRPGSGHGPGGHRRVPSGIARPIAHRRCPFGVAGAPALEEHTNSLERNDKAREVQQDHRTERGRATSVSHSDATGRPDKVGGQVPALLRLRVNCRWTRQPPPNAGLILPTARLVGEQENENILRWPRRKGILR